MKYHKVFSGLAAVILSAVTIVSCTGSISTLSTEEFIYADSTSVLTSTVRLELPDGDNPTAKSIKSTLLINAQNSYRQFENPEIDLFARKHNLKPISDCGTDEAKVFFAISTKKLRREAARMKKEMELNAEPGFDFPTWEYSVTTEKIYESKKVCVFQQMDSMFAGGAHGSIGGPYILYFDKVNGKQFSNIIRQGSEDALQEKIRKGLCDYFETTDCHLDEFLLIGSDLIPLPQEDPAPCKEGLVFTYSQYEIAPYAAGMPSFTITWKDVKNYLTTEAERLLI